MVAKILEGLRWFGCCVGFYFAYGYYGAGDAVKAIHVLSPWVVGFVAGFTGLGALFFYKYSSEALGWKNQTAFHKEVGYFNLGCAFVAVLVYFLNWGLYADMTIFLTFSLFLIMSSINHSYEVIAKKNYSWQNAIRPILMILWIIFTIPLFAAALTAYP